MSRLELSGADDADGGATDCLKTKSHQEYDILSPQAERPDDWNGDSL